MSNKTSDKNVANIEDDVNELKSIMNLRTESGFAYSQKNTLKLQKSIRNVLAEREQDKKRIQELEEERDNWHGCFIVAMENGIAKEKVKEILQDNRNELFSITYLSKEQYRLYEIQIERINKIEQELLEGEK